MSKQYLKALLPAVLALALSLSFSFIAVDAIESMTQFRFSPEFMVLMGTLVVLVFTLPASIVTLYRLSQIKETNQHTTSDTMR